MSNGILPPQTRRGRRLRRTRRWPRVVVGCPGLETLGLPTLWRRSNRRRGGLKRAAAALRLSFRPQRLRRWSGRMPMVMQLRGRTRCRMCRRARERERAQARRLTVAAVAARMSLHLGRAWRVSRLERIREWHWWKRFSVAWRPVEPWSWPSRESCIGAGVGQKAIQLDGQRRRCGGRRRRPPVLSRSRPAKPRRRFEWPAWWNGTGPIESGFRWRARMACEAATRPCRRGPDWRLLQRLRMKAAGLWWL